MVITDIELANHICNEVPGLDFDEVLKRIQKTFLHQTEVELSQEKLDTIVGEYRTFFSGELDF